MASAALGGSPGGHWDSPFLIDDQQGAGSYGSEVIASLIGPSDVLLRIHKHLLETMTYFFAYHPDAGRMAHGSDQEDAPPARNGEPIPYSLREVQTGTFRIFEELLYEKPIGVPASPAVLRKFLDTYLLATRYEAFSLLDTIMDGVRQYPLGKVFKFEFLTYALDRHIVRRDQ